MNKVHPNGEWDGPFKCKYPECGQNFDTEPNLKAHILAEHGPSDEATKGVLCFSCGKIFSSTQAEGYHKLVHSKEKAHKCHICTSAFAVKSSLQLHLATNHGVGTETWKCEEESCGRVFSNRKFYQAHRRIKHGVYLKKCRSNPKTT